MSSIYIPLNLLLQTTSILIIYLQSSEITFTKNQIVIFTILSGLGFVLLDYASYLVVISLLYFFGLQNRLGHRKYLSLFFSLYALSFFTSMGNILDLLTSSAALNHKIIDILVIPIPVILNYLFIKTTKPDFHFLHSSYQPSIKMMIRVTNTILFVLLSAEFSSYFLESIHHGFGMIRYAVSVIFLMSMTILLVYIRMKIKLIQSEEIKELRQSQLQQLSTYTKQVESMYNEIHEVRHDLGNVLASLQESINEQDLPTIASIYNTVIKKYGQPLQDSKFNLTHLNKLEIPALKSLISTKVIAANTAHIEINVEIENTINDCYIDLIDYIRILSIFIDNAIEANESVKDPKINMAFIIKQKPKQLIFLIDNTTNKQFIDVNSIFEPHNSTKGNSHGLGLTIVKELLNRHPNLMLQTEFKNGTFRQSLISSPKGE